MSETYQYDLIVIGSGPGGYVSAIRAAQLGLKAVVIEKDKPGGVCLNVGCIPSKALIRQAEIYGSIKELESLGIKVDTSEFDYLKVFKKSRKAAMMLGKGVEFLLKKNKIELIASEAKLAGANQVILTDGRKLTAKYILVATGSRPKEIPGFPFDGERVLSSTDALMLEKLPQKIIILGSGAIGVEFSYIMNAFGVEVVLVEMLPTILPLEDSETVAVLSRAFQRKGIKILSGTKALSMEKIADGIEIALENPDGVITKDRADAILVAVGRRSNIEDLGLESVGVEIEKGFVKTFDYYQTSIPAVFAIGDIVNSPLLAHVASKEGEIAVSYMADIKREKKIDPLLIPSAVYCEPQVASFGYTEEQLKKQEIAYEKATFPYRGVGKAVAVEKSEGLLKVLFALDTKKILGVHIVGAEATELIHELLLACQAKLSPAETVEMIHAHPTLSEGVMEVMRAVEGWAIHN